MARVGSDSPSDEQLLAAAASDPQAFAEFYDRFEGAVLHGASAWSHSR